MQIKKELIPIYILTFVNMVSFTILIPVYPFIVRFYNQSPVIYGILLSTYSIFQYISSPFLGRLSDKYGRRPILIITQTGTLVSWILFGTAYFLPTIEVFFLPLPIFVILISKMFDGITGGNISVANAYVSDIATTKNERNHVFNNLGLIMGACLILGPALGGITNSTQYRFLGTSIFAATVSLIALILIVTNIKESLHKKKRKTNIDMKLLKSLNVLTLIKPFTKKYPHLKKIFIVNIAFSLVFAAYIAIIAPYSVEAFQYQEKQLTILFLIIGFYVVINQLIIARYIINKIGNVRSMLFGVGLFALGLIFVPVITKEPTYYIFTYIQILGVSLCIPTFKSILTSIVKENEQGEILGIEESILAFFTSFMPIVITTIYVKFYVDTFMFLSAILLISLVVYVIFKQHLYNLHRR